MRVFQTRYKWELSILIFYNCNLSPTNKCIVNNNFINAGIIYPIKKLYRDGKNKYLYLEFNKIFDVNLNVKENE